MTYRRKLTLATAMLVAAWPAASLAGAAAGDPLARASARLIAGDLEAARRETDAAERAAGPSR